MGAFFIDLLKTQGITHNSIDEDFVTINPTTLLGDFYKPDYFLVKNWTSNSSSNPFTDLNSIYGKLIIPEQSYPPNGDYDANWMTYNFIYGTWIASNMYNWYFSDLSNPSGISGQGNNQIPQSVFANHQFCNINSEFLDPSYGSSYSSTTDIKDNYLYGFGKITLRLVDENDLLGNSAYDYNGNGLIESNSTLLFIVVSEDKSLFNISTDISNY